MRVVRVYRCTCPARLLQLARGRRDLLARPGVGELAGGGGDAVRALRDGAAQLVHRLLPVGHQLVRCVVVHLEGCRVQRRGVIQRNARPTRPIVSGKVMVY